MRKRLRFSFREDEVARRRRSRRPRQEKKHLRFQLRLGSSSAAEPGLPICSAVRVRWPISVGARWKRNGASHPRRERGNGEGEGRRRNDVALKRKRASALGAAPFPPSLLHNSPFGGTSARIVIRSRAKKQCRDSSRAGKPMPRKKPTTALFRFEKKDFLSTLAQGPASRHLTEAAFEDAKRTNSREAAGGDIVWPVFGSGRDDGAWNGGQR